MTLRGSRIQRGSNCRCGGNSKKTRIRSQALSPSTSGEDAMQIVEMTTKDLEYHINLVDKIVAGLKRIDSNLKVLLWVKCYQTTVHATDKSFPRCVPLTGIKPGTFSPWVKALTTELNQLGILSYFETLPQSPQPSATITLISQQLSNEGKALHQQKYYNLMKAQMMKFLPQDLLAWEAPPPVHPSDHDFECRQEYHPVNIREKKPEYQHAVSSC
ncbi:hypothetical protein QTO34_008364 [Cnephaeus nilssonii]|uniref:Uncharacterized protein n=1 Tax=Cnephaeus nilssonii TaxID=3371016 RepID=A0AA40LW98_CNENI|nr:hypothetical protein QTO34_008364 [Eptesicus nilssonii]